MLDLAQHFLNARSHVFCKRALLNIIAYNSNYIYQCKVVFCFMALLSQIAYTMLGWILVYSHVVLCHIRTASSLYYPGISDKFKSAKFGLYVRLSVFLYD